MRVEVYWNLHRHCWSVRALEGEDKGRVIMHTDRVFLGPVQFVVQKAGQRKVRETGHKEIHAFVRGHILPDGWVIPLTGSFESFTYNPYRDDQFKTKGDDPRPINSGDVAILGSDHSKPVTYVINAT